MSYEGYEQHICKNGHLFIVDAHSCLASCDRWPAMYRLLFPGQRRLFPEGSQEPLDPDSSED